jgi:signal transduction histidine kinase
MASPTPFGTVPRRRGGTQSVAVGDRAALLAPYDVIGRPPMPDLTALAELAAGLCDTPIGVVNLIDDHRLYSVATYGWDVGACDRADSLCTVTIAATEPIVVPDTRRDPRFAANPFVTGAKASVRFYAASQLRNPHGEILGTLCAFDSEPRELDDRRIRGLNLLARQVTDALELRRRTTALVDAVTELAEVRSELTRSNEALHAFAGQVSHDLRHPLTTAMGYLEELAEEAVERADAGAGLHAGRALASCARMTSMISDLLGFAQLGGALRREPCPLQRIVDEVREDLAPALTAVGATIECGPLPIVSADRVQVASVLQNLISNAAKYRHPDRPPQITVQARREGDSWRVEIVDNGIGIPPERREAAFAPLRRVHEGPSGPPADGHGIGLATCRRIVAAHGGRIGLADSPEGEGRGTTAWFTLPDARGVGSPGHALHSVR